jgi:hypothetical protein
MKFTYPSCHCVPGALSSGLGGGGAKTDYLNPSSTLQMLKMSEYVPPFHYMLLWLTQGNL